MSGLPARILAAYRRLASDQRMAAVASLGLFVTMFLPWYQITAARGKSGGLEQTSLSAFQDFSFIEAAVLLVAVGILFLLFSRAERRAFHLPGGDGTVILVAGGWATLLLVWRAFDKPNGHDLTAVGLDWGFVFAFAASGALTYAGHRVRLAHRPEPPNPVAEEPDTTTPLTPPDPPPAAPAAPAAPPSTTPPAGPYDPPTAPTQAGAPDPPTTPLRREPAEPPPEPDRGPAGWAHADDGDHLPLTAAHGSEEPLPPDEGR